MSPRRSTPEIMQRASELRKTPEPAEAKLWAYLRTLRDQGGERTVTQTIEVK